MSKRVANVGMLIALAMIFSYVEALLPFNFGIPGVKLGVANLVIVTSLYLLKPKDVWCLSLLRILLMGFLFGNGMSILYSLAGGIFSLLMMLILKTKCGFSIVGISIAGGVSHNVGQLMAAACIVGNLNIAYYLPVLLIAGLITGAIIGILSDKILLAVGGEGKRKMH